MRRMGKTEIFKRVINRLFFEQENRAALCLLCRNKITAKQARSEE